MNFKKALGQYLEIVEGVASEYKGKATITEIRVDHPELNFFDDEEITDILRLSNKYIDLTN